MLDKPILIWQSPVLQFKLEITLTHMALSI